MKASYCSRAFKNLYLPICWNMAELKYNLDKLVILIREERNGQCFLGGSQVCSLYQT